MILTQTEAVCPVKVELGSGAGVGRPVVAGGLRGGIGVAGQDRSPVSACLPLPPGTRLDHVRIMILRLGSFQDDGHKGPSSCLTVKGHVEN